MFSRAIANAALAPLTPQPTMAASTELVDKFSSLLGRVAYRFLPDVSLFGDFDAAFPFHLS
jgi:hypothetical protein